MRYEVLRWCVFLEKVIALLIERPKLRDLRREHFDVVVDQLIDGDVTTKDVALVWPAGRCSRP